VKNVPVRRFDLRHFWDSPIAPTFRTTRTQAFSAPSMRAWVQIPTRGASPDAAPWTSVGAKW
jgi:hypothetical protein